MANIKVYEEDISCIYFDAQDLKRTLEANKLDKYKRVQQVESRIHLGSKPELIAT